MKSKKFDILILGAGASGLMLASLLKGNKSVAIVDGNSQIGKKLSITGGGRCNICNQNLKASNFLGDEVFVRSVLKRFDQNRLIKWLKSNKIELSLEKNEQFFCKDSAKAVIKLFEKSTRGATLLTNHKIQSLKYRNGEFTLQTERGQIVAKKVVVATGGVSFPALGATGVGYEIAKSFGHKISKISPALVGLTLQREQFFMKELSGISAQVSVRVGEKRFDGNILFTHKGISGPVILNASLYWQRGEIEIDFLPNFSLSRLKGRKQLSTLLPLPKRLSKALLAHLKIEDRVAERLSADELQRLKRLKEYRFAPAGSFGYGRAEVTRGGVLSNEIDSQNMMSRLQKNLFFIGEVVNVTGELGGYNLQWAFSSAYCAALRLNDKL